MKAFDPSAVAVKNGNFFGFPYTPEEAEIVILSAPWDVSTSYRDGTAKGPAAVLSASYQLDFSSPFRKEAWKTKIATIPAKKSWALENKKLRAKAKQHIATLEKGKKPDPKTLSILNKKSAQFHAELEELASFWLNRGKRVFTLGGDHSISFGPIRALAKRKKFSVLHIDAHADLRVAYEGFEHSHASIMHHVANMNAVDTIVQVGLRDISPEEIECITKNPKIQAYLDADLRRETAKGKNWNEICDKIIAPLGKEVYLSLDVDGLDPKYCPNTGTPVPGGLEYWEFFSLLEAVERSGRKIIGADLVEVAPGKDEWDANVGARLLFQICQFLSA